MRTQPRPIHPLWANLCIGMLIVATPIVGGGCSKEKIQQVYQEARAKTEEYTEKAVAKVEKTLPPDGSIELITPDPVKKTKAANIELIDIGDGRPACVQIASYDLSADHPTYPAIHLHGQTHATKILELANTTISCDMYLQSVYGGRIAITPDGESVRLKFGAYDPDEGLIRATLSRAELRLSDDANFLVEGGEIVAVVKEQNE